jgi:uncharacterized protein YggE
MVALRVALPAVLVAVAATAASAQSAPPRSISVSGNAEVRVTPDEVILSVGVETDSKDIAVARSENDARVRAISQAVQAQGVPANLVRTDYLNLEPRYRNYPTREDFLGYFARRSLVITIRDISKFESILTAAIGAGANYVHGVDFRTTELRKHRDAARRLALNAAREKAEAMAGTFNVALGEPMSISEGYSSWFSPYSSWWGNRFGGQMAQNVVQDNSARGAGGDDALVPGQISVSASVNVTFELGRQR